MTQAVTVAQLVKEYPGQVRALDGIDLGIEPGEIFGVIGPNGAGKTTLMRILLDIIRPTSGTVEVLGWEPRRGGGELRRRIGYLPGELLLDGRTTVQRLLDFYAHLSGGVDPDRMQGLIDRFGLDTSKQVRTLSKGNKQKLGVIQAFMHRPELVVLDEPTSGLDPILQQEFLAVAREARDEGATIFLSSHVLSEIQHVADRVAILRAGRIVTVSDVDSLRRVASRTLRFRFDRTVDRTAIEHLPGVEGVEEEGGWTVVHVGVDNPLRPLMEVAVTMGIEDLIAEEPDLEQAVLRYYRSDRAVV